MIASDSGSGEHDVSASLPDGATLGGAAPKVLTQELGREPFAVFCQNDGFGFRLRIDNPSFFVEQIHQIPIEPLPDPTVVMKRERQNRKRSFCQFGRINFLRQFVRWHFVPSRPATLAKSSHDTALRDIQDLIDQGMLKKDSAGGRSTSYSLNEN
jgi:hypothetical protein